jgi:Tfp pilus assembly protein PilF
MPDRAEIRRDLGKAYRKAGRPADARAAWEAVAKAHPNDDQVHFLLGGLYRELGEAALAQRELSLHRKLLEHRRSSAERR